MWMAMTLRKMEVERRVPSTSDWRTGIHRQDAHYVNYQIVIHSRMEFCLVKTRQKSELELVKQ